jgi:hypothetical protein
MSVVGVHGDAGGGMLPGNRAALLSVALGAVASSPPWRPARAEPDAEGIDPGNARMPDASPGLVRPASWARATNWRALLCETGIVWLQLFSVCVQVVWVSPFSCGLVGGFASCVCVSRSVKC